MTELHSAADDAVDVGAVSQAPNMSSVLNGCLDPMSFVIVTKAQDPVTKEIVNTTCSVTTMAVIQPLRTRELAMKPEGERSWQWYKIFALPDLMMKLGDMVTIGAETFRVMGSRNWSSKGYVYYEIVDTFTPPTGYA